METTLVVFRRWLDTGDIIALFPAEPSDIDGWYCLSYERVGQHSGADFHGVVQATRPATAEEAAPLAEELTRLGYNLQPSDGPRRPPTSAAGPRQERSGQPRFRDVYRTKEDNTHPSWKERTMATQELIDWFDVKSAAEALAGNWRDFDSFAWHRGFELEDADSWMIWYTSSQDAGLLRQSNEAAINKRLEPFAEGDNPDLVFESHGHWAVGHVDGFSVRVFKPDGTITPAFEEFCRIKAELDAYPILDESNYSEREYEATLENYREALWRLRDELPEGWEAEVYLWFSDNGMDRFTENVDDRGGWAPKEKLIEALEALGLYPQEADQPVIVNVPSKDQL
jgi:hypothetical protein